jgi:hypothetical protein
MKENSALVLEVQEQIYLKTIGTILAECVLYKHLFQIRLLKSSEGKGEFCKTCVREDTTG